jgi:1-acyl-sn-glycerol-3-phosphate acyltransferase
VATFVVMSTLTPAGRKSLRDNPGRLAEAAARVRRLGGRVVKQYATLGKHDLVTFVEAPDNATMARISSEFGSASARLTTFPAVEMDRFQKTLGWELYRTEPHRWQTAWWARIVRRVAQHFQLRPIVNQWFKPYTVEGRENLKGFNGPAVIIGNHSSHMDGPALMTALPERIRTKLLAGAAADKWYRRTRPSHWKMSLFNGTFPVHRGGGVKQLEYPIELFKKGWSVLLFPEGTRSRTGKVARFKHGATIMAIQGGVPVIPIWMEGLREIMPKGSRTALQPGPVTVRIGKPVSLADLTIDQLAEGTERLENAMRELAGQPAHHAAAEAFARDHPAAAASASGGAR